MSKIKKITNKTIKKDDFFISMTEFGINLLRSNGRTGSTYFQLWENSSTELIDSKYFVFYEITETALCLTTDLFICLTDEHIKIYNYDSNDKLNKIGLDFSIIECFLSKYGNNIDISMTELFKAIDNFPTVSNTIVIDKDIIEQIDDGNNNANLDANNILIHNNINNEINTQIDNNCKEENIEYHKTKKKKQKIKDNDSIVTTKYSFKTRSLVKDEDYQYYSDDIEYRLENNNYYQSNDTNSQDYDFNHNQSPETATKSNKVKYSRVFNKDKQIIKSIESNNEQQHYEGVFPYRNRFRSYFTHMGETKLVPGLFDSTIEAALARDELIAKLQTNLPLNFTSESTKALYGVSTDKIITNKSNKTNKSKINTIDVKVNNNMNKTYVTTFNHSFSMHFSRNSSNSSSNNFGNNNSSNSNSLSTKWWWENRLLP